jgi:hypothetical protein
MQDSSLVTGAIPSPQGSPRAEAAFFAGAAPAPIQSGDIRVGGEDFSAWFNASVRGEGGFNTPIVDEHFRGVFDNVADLWSPSLTLAEFVGFFCIFYNETGGTMQPIAERGGPRYCFETRLPGGGAKRSYNEAPNRLAGDQLAVQGVISDPRDIAAWNGKAWPSSAPDEVKTAAEQCDFYKYRGRGLIQTTWRQTYIAQVDPLLAQAGLRCCDAMTSEELDAAVLQTPAVYLGMVKAFFQAPRMAAAFAKVNQSTPLWAPTGTGVSGRSAYGNGLYSTRCRSLYQAMTAAGYDAR